MRQQGISPVSEVRHFRRLQAAFVSAKPKINIRRNNGRKFYVGTQGYEALAFSRDWKTGLFPLAQDPGCRGNDVRSRESTDQCHPATQVCKISFWIYAHEWVRSRLALGTGNSDDVCVIERVDAGGGWTYRCVKTGILRSGDDDELRAGEVCVNGDTGGGAVRCPGGVWSGTDFRFGCRAGAKRWESD